MTFKVQSVHLLPHPPPVHGSQLCVRVPRVCGCRRHSKAVMAKLYEETTRRVSSYYLCRALHALGARRQYILNDADHAAVAAAAQDFSENGTLTIQSEYYTVESETPSTAIQSEYWSSWARVCMQVCMCQHASASVRPAFSEGGGESCVEEAL